MICPTSSDFRQPVDVVEAALDVAAMLGGGTLVAELRPELFLVIERDNEIGAELLEEIGLFDSLQQNHPIGFPRHLGISQLVAILCVLIEAPDAVFEQRFYGRVLGRLFVPRFDRGDVIIVNQEVVRIDIARDLNEGLQRRGRQRGRVGCPRILDADPGARRNGGNRNRGRGALQKGSAAIFASTIYFSHWYPPLNIFCCCLLYTSPSPRDRTRSRMPSSA